MKKASLIIIAAALSLMIFRDFAFCKDFEAMYFLNSLTGWIYGPNGAIAKTTDGGNSWIEQNSSTANFILKAYFIDDSTGWACGYSGTFIKTTNGGNTWTPLSVGTTASIISVFFYNQNRGWVVGDSGIILSTLDGGDNWTRQASGTTNSLRTIKFVDTSNGWAVGNSGAVVHTTNGGLIWSAQSSGTTQTLWNSCFLDSLHGFIIGGDISTSSNIFLKTINGGTSWLSQSLPASTLLDIGFINADTGWVIGRSGYILKTTNGGNNWVDQGTTSYWLSWASFVNKDTGYVLNPGSSPRLLITYNGGSSWWTLAITIGSTEIETIDALLPRENVLEQNYPNPFNPLTKIQFSVAESGYVQLKIFNLSGQEVATLVSQDMAAGTYTTLFSAANLSSGTYFYKLNIGDFVATKKMIVMK